MSGGPAGRENPTGLTLVDALALPDPLGDLCTRLLRDRQLTLESVVSFLGHDEEYARAILADLLERGFVVEVKDRDIVYYRVRFAGKRGQNIPANLWEAPEDH